MEILALRPLPKPYWFCGQSSGPFPRRDLYSPAPSSPTSFRSESPSRWRTDTAESCRAPSAPSLCRGPRWSPAPARTRAPLRRVGSRRRRKALPRSTSGTGTVPGFLVSLRPPGAAACTHHRERRLCNGEHAFALPEGPQSFAEKIISGTVTVRPEVLGRAPLPNLSAEAVRGGWFVTSNTVSPPAPCTTSSAPTGRSRTP